MRWSVRSLLARREPLVFSGVSNPDLAERTADRLGLRLGPVEHETFGNGETYCRFGESIRGADVFLIQSCSPPVNDHLVELLLMIQAARLASAHRITAVMPWSPYSQQDERNVRCPGKPRDRP
jgi:ribose-phosphate pyrophosphokinase